MSTNGASPNEMNEVALFTDALRAAVPTRPDPGIGTALVPRLAQAARAATAEVEAPAKAPEIPRRPAPRLRTRRSLVARIAIAVCLIPLALAGLAFAGVSVPDPARDAFDSVGISLPNQPADQGPTEPPATKDGKPASGEGSGNEVSEAAQSKSKGTGGNSGAAHEQAREQREKAQGKAKGHDRGKAVGLNDATPPGQSGQTGPPSHSNAGGGGGGASSGNSSQKAPKPSHAPKGAAKGHTKTPPGQAKP
jgi:hypothetical protein